MAETTVKCESDLEGPLVQACRHEAVGRGWNRDSEDELLGLVWLRWSHEAEGGVKPGPELHIRLRRAARLAAIDLIRSRFREHDRQTATLLASKRLREMHRTDAADCTADEFLVECRARGWLSDMQERIVRLCICECRTKEEICGELGWPLKKAGSVRKRLHESLQSLRIIAATQHLRCQWTEALGIRNRGSP